MNFKLCTYFALRNFQNDKNELSIWVQINIFTKKSYFSPNHIDIKSIQQMSKCIYFDATEATETYLLTHMIHLMMKNNLIHVSVISYKIYLISEGSSVNFMQKSWELSKHIKNSVVGYYQLGYCMQISREPVLSNICQQWQFQVDTCKIGVRIVPQNSRF